MAAKRRIYLFTAEDNKNFMAFMIRYVDINRHSKWFSLSHEY